MNNYGGQRLGAGRKNKWGFPTSDLKVKKLPYQVIDILEVVREKYQGSELLVALLSLTNDQVKIVPLEKVTKPLEKVTESTVIPALKKYICELIDVSEKTADRRIRRAKQALNITGAITPERQVERYRVVQYILDNEPEKVT